MADKNTRHEGKLDTIIGKGTKIEGTLTVEGATRIDGFVSGKLISDDVVTIGADGEVNATVKAKSIIVGGRVRGNLEAVEKIELQSKAELRGDLVAKSLLVEHGAVFHGTSNMLGEQPSLSGAVAAGKPTTTQMPPGKK